MTTPVVRTIWTIDSPADLIRRYLVSKKSLSMPSGVEGVDWAAFVSELPYEGTNVPDNAVCFYDTSGLFHGRLMLGPSLGYPGVQARIRAVGHKEAQDKAVELVRALEQVKSVPFQVQGRKYLLQSVHMTTGIVSRGEVDAKRRMEMIFNFRLSVMQV